jgi:hypothetical protein
MTARKLALLILAAPLLLAAGYSATTLLHTHQSDAEGGALNAAAVGAGTLPIARGGTNGTATPTLGAVAYGTGSALAWSGAPGATGDCLKGDTTGSPTWGSCAAGGGYATVQDETTPLTQRTTINFTGSGVSCVDNGGTSTTDCTITSGGGSPAGNTGEVQYNNGGAFAGAANVEISAAGNLNLVATTTPATPAAGIGTLYMRQRAGRTIPTVISPDGTQQTTQEAIFSNSVQIMSPNTGTTVPTAFGNTWIGRASTGTLSHPAIATTNHLTLMRQSLYTSGAAAGQGFGIQGGFAMNYLGNAANRGGFFFFCRFGFTAYTSAARVFIGFSTQNAAYGATEPSTVGNNVGLCKDSTDAAISFCTRNGTTTTKNSANTFTPTTGRVYDLTMSAPPNSTTITYRLVDETTDVVIWDNLTTSTTPPTVNTLMYPWTWVGASSAVSQIMAVGKVYVSNDY